MEYFGLTDKGRVRPTNQDIFQIEAREDNRTAPVRRIPAQKPHVRRPFTAVRRGR